MNSGRLGPRRFRFDPAAIAGPLAGPHLLAPPPRPAAGEVSADRLENAIRRTRDYLLDHQHLDGYWVGELEGDTILESEFILLLAWMGRERTETARLAANYLLRQQLPQGGWSSYPGGPIEVSASVKAYFALKLTGHSPDAEPMRRARAAIRAAGGAEKVNSFTRYFLALLGVISYDQCPAVPPELVLIPPWMPFNIYEMSAWSRTIIVPLSLLWAFRPVRTLPEESGIRELFLRSPEELPCRVDRDDTLDELTRPTRIDWARLFDGIDRCYKLLDRCRLRPLRRRAVRRAAEWMIARFEDSDGLGAIFPPIIWSVVALRCLGHAEDSPLVRAALGELDRLMIRAGDTIRLQPCKSPVWDTAISLIALREAGVAAEDSAIRSGVQWLLEREVRAPGDWAASTSAVEPSGWYFEFANKFYPDVDDTSMVVMALARAFPGRDERGLRAEFALDGPPAVPSAEFPAAVLSGRSDADEDAAARAVAAAEQAAAIVRGARWALAMQGRDGGWGAFDRDNARELFTRVPFADHNAMIDPSTEDLAGRMLEMCGRLGLPHDHPAIRRAIDFLWKTQQPEGCWHGRWGVNYIYGTWQCLVGLSLAGVSANDPRIRKAADWLVSVQQHSGGWGESPATYDDPSLKGQGPATASQTAWALMGLMAAGLGDSAAVRRGVRYLLNTQNADGTWDEEAFTGTGFPRVFYLRYHMYCIYFPLIALARYADLKRGAAARS
ncbi:MAG: prenyltransferase/squalene oxidase repeat-containing protein [Planctomycetales bacterium]